MHKRERDRNGNNYITRNFIVYFLFLEVAVTGLTMMNCTCGFDNNQVMPSFGEPGYKVNLSL